MPTISTVRGSGLTWNDVARYYGMSLAQLMRDQPNSVINQAMRQGGNSRVPGGLTLTVPNVRDERGQQRKQQNVFRNEAYIERRTNPQPSEQEYWASTQVDWTWLQNHIAAGGAPPDWWQNILDSGRPLPDWIPATGGWGGAGVGPGDGTSVAFQPGTGQGGEGDEDDPADDPENPGGGGAIDADGGMSDIEVGNAYAEAIAAMPWLVEMGVADQVDIWIREGRETAWILNAIRTGLAGGGYDQMFQNIRRPDGTMRMNEAAYLSQMDSYRAVMNRYGLGDAYDNGALSNFLANDVDVNELSQRLQTWDAIQRGSDDLRAAFYVYGGISLSADDLYNYVVDPVERGNMDAQYAANSGSLDYPTFLARVTDMAMAGQFAGSGGFDRDTTSALLDQLVHGGDPVNGTYLSLSELMNAYEAAMIGSAATAVGLVLPDISRINEFREVGISHAQARQGYGQFARDQNFLNAVVQRARGTGFDQGDFEEASFLSDPDAQRDLTRGMAQEEARGRDGGGFTFGQTDGRLTQEGLSAFRN